MPQNIPFLSELPVAQQLPVVHPHPIAALELSLLVINMNKQRSKSASLHKSIHHPSPFCFARSKHVSRPPEILVVGTLPSDNDLNLPSTLVAS